MSQYDSAPADTPEVQLSRYVRLFTEARDLTQISRQGSKLARRYYDGDQISPAALKRLRARKEPEFVINRVRPGIEGMVGVVEKGQVDPQCWPREPDKQDGAEIATDSLRYVKDTNRWDQNKLKVFRNMCVEGTAAIIVEVDDQLDVKIKRIRFEEFFYDPYSREPDFSDASYMGVAKWMYVDEIVSLYPEFEAQLQQACSTELSQDSTWGDRPDNNSVTWSDPKRKRLLLVEMYKRERGIWLKCVFTGQLKLEEGASPYVDDLDKPMNPIEGQSVYVDDDNSRYGMVADMMGPQDEINTYRRKGAWFSTFRQLQESDPSSAGVDPAEARAEAMKPDGVIPSGWQIVSNTDKFQMDMTLLAEAKSEIERMGPAPAILGRQNATASGRSDLIKQQAGLTELAHLYDGLEDLELRMYNQAWQRIRQYWTEPKFIRVTDDVNAVKFLQINEPIWGPPAPVIDQATGMPKYDPVTRQIMMAPQYLGMKNAVAEMGVDIILDTTPETATVQQEQFQALVDLIKAGVQIPPKALLMASSLPKKREILDLMDAPQQGPSPEQQEAQRIAANKERSEIDKNLAAADASRATAVLNMVKAGAQEVATPFSDGELIGGPPQGALPPVPINALGAGPAPVPTQASPVPSPSPAVGPGPLS